MENMLIEKTKSSPKVVMNAITGEWEISGSSYPENASEFYLPVFAWIDKFLMEVTKEVTMNFNLDYLNSSSIKFISEIVDKLNKYCNAGINVEINWKYNEIDDDIKELGEEFKEETACKFNLIEI